MRLGRTRQAGFLQFAGKPLAAVLPAAQCAALPPQGPAVAEVVRFLRANQHTYIKELAAPADSIANRGRANIKAEDEACTKIADRGGGLFHGLRRLEGLLGCIGGWLEPAVLPGGPHGVSLLHRDLANLAGLQASQAEVQPVYKGAVQEQRFAVSRSGDPSAFTAVCA